MGSDDRLGRMHLHALDVVHGRHCILPPFPRFCRGASFLRLKGSLDQSLYTFACGHGMNTSRGVDVSVKGDLSNDVDPGTIAILPWLREHDIWLHPDLTIQPLGDGLDAESPKEEPSAGHNANRPMGIFLSPTSSPLPIPSGTPIVLIPKTACLSPRTSALRPHLATLDIDPVFGPQATSGLLLTFCLLYEKHIGEASAFHGYLQSLPRERPGGRFGICLALERGEHAPALGDTVLQGTETGRLLQRAELRAHDPATSPGWPSHSSDTISLSLLRHFYVQTVLPFFTSPDPAISKEQPDFVWSDFLGSYSLVSSRAFVCDTYHGLALVPLADIFNHAEPAEEGEEDGEVQQHVQFECEDLVCIRCGSLTDSETGRCKKRCKFSEQQEPSNRGKENSGDDDEDDDDDDEDLIYMTTIMPLYASPARPLEIFNNYGPLSPARLLASYGFIAESGPVNRWERYTWDWRSSVERAELLAALGLNDKEEGQAFSRKRSHDNSEHDDGSTTNGKSSGAQHRWSHLVSTLAGSEADVAEALFISSEPIHTSNKRQSAPHPTSAPTSRLLPLPKQSPFFLMDVHTREEDCSELLVTPSAEDGEYTADEVLPLFIDGRGRISRPLWTIFILAALVRDAPSNSQAEGSQERLVQLLKSVEECAAARLAGVTRPGEAIGTILARDREERALQSRILSSAASMLYTLVEARRDSIAIPTARVEPSTAEEQYLQSCALRLALKERSVLLETLQKLEALMYTEETPLLQIDGRDRIALGRGNADLR